jgi:hypothetical protein
MSRSDRRRIRPAKTVLFSVSGKAEEVLPSGDQDRAELLEIDISDLTALSFGIKSTMWMSRSQQLDRDLPINRPATDALRIANGLALAIRGPVIVCHEEADFSPRHRRLQRPS